MVMEGQVYFLKMTNGEDLLCLVSDDDPSSLYVSNPYRIELIPGSDMTIMTSIVRWFPFTSLMQEKIRLDKRNILTYILVDDEVSIKYLNSIHRERIKELSKRNIEDNKTTIDVANSSSGTFH